MRIHWVTFENATLYDFCMYVLMSPWPSRVVWPGCFHPSCLRALYSAPGVAQMTHPMFKWTLGCSTVDPFPAPITRARKSIAEVRVRGSLPNPYHLDDHVCFTWFGDTR